MLFNLTKFSNTLSEGIVTMVELLLVLGLVSLMTLGIYSQLGKSEKETESLNEVQK